MFSRNGCHSGCTRRDESRPLRNVLVTGGCGFIGSNFINLFMQLHPNVHVYNFDRMDYCSNKKSIEHDESPYYHFVFGDICDAELITRLLRDHDIDTVVHFAAESHVENSFGNSITFTISNVLGTHTLLECVRHYGQVEKFIHVSSDEVYGTVSEQQTEDGTLNPTNPYAATKAAAEYIVKAYHVSFGLPVIITRGNNVYGRYQYPEKVIPRFLMLLYAGEKLTIQGSGKNTRTFIHVSDVVNAFCILVESGVIGNVYNIGNRDEYSILDVARMSVQVVKGTKEASDENFKKYITFVKDRNFNDERYDIDSTKMESLGWKCRVGFAEGFRDTAEWYKKALANNFWPTLQEHIPSIGPVETVLNDAIPGNRAL